MDIKRNISVKRIAKLRKGGKEFLFTTSEDFHMTYDCETCETLSCRLRDNDLDTLMDCFPPTNPSDYREEFDQINDDLRALATLVADHELLFGPSQNARPQSRKFTYWSGRSKSFSLRNAIVS